MIVGIGTDLVDSARIADVLRRHGDRFLTRCFAPEERGLAARDPAAPVYYAKRFAAKEAGAKALHTGIAQGVFLRDIVVEAGRKAAPILHLRGGAGAALDRLAGGRSARVHLSLSDEPPHVLAFVLIETLPADGRYD